MKKAFGLIALLACSAAVTVSPALAGDRDDYNLRNAHTTYVVDRDHDRRDNDRDRRDNGRDAARYNTNSYGRDDGSYRR
jgi:hypothetical protein